MESNPFIPLDCESISSTHNTHRFLETLILVNPVNKLFPNAILLASICKEHNRRVGFLSVRNCDGQLERHKTSLQPESQLLNSSPQSSQELFIHSHAFFHSFISPEWTLKDHAVLHFSSPPLSTKGKKKKKKKPLQTGTPQLCSNNTNHLPLSRHSFLSALIETDETLPGCVCLQTTPRDGAATAALGNLCQHLATLSGRNFSPAPHLPLPSDSFKGMNKTSDLKWAAVCPLHPRLCRWWEGTDKRVRWSLAIPNTNS